MKQDILRVARAIGLHWTPSNPEDAEFGASLTLLLSKGEIRW